jgi:hypothetical protein
VDDPNDPNSDDSHKLIKIPYCKLIEHQWECCDGPKYVKNNARCFRRSCYLCCTKFQQGTSKKGEEGKYWLSNTNHVMHSTHCKICLCAGCHPEFLKQPGLLEKQQSPRAAKSKHVKYGP